MESQQLQEKEDARKSQARREQLSLQHKNKIISPETRAKISASNKGKTLPPEQIEKIRLANTGKTRTPEQRENISKGIKASTKPRQEMTEESRKARSEKLKGRVFSQETKDKMAASAERRWRLKRAEQMSPKN